MKGGGLVAFDVVRSPVQTMERVASERMLAAGFGVVAASAVLGLISSVISVLGGATASQFNPQNFPTVPPEGLRTMTTAIQVATPVFAAVSPFVSWAVISLVMQLVTRFFGGSGPLSGMFAAVGVASVPSLISGALGIIFSGLVVAVGPQSAAASVVGIVSSLVGLALFAWQVALVIIGARFARGISYGQSGGSCAISCAGCAGSLVLILVVVVVIIALAVGASGGQ